MKYFLLTTLAVLAVFAVSREWVGASDMPSGTGSPVLVELFTSEGCSSCPPADALLQKLDQSGSQVVVLSEHVDYWNQLGWRDPFSSSFFSQRQSAYASHFGLSGVYTPQMVVDGSAEFVGSDSNQASDQVQKAGTHNKVPVRLSSPELSGKTLQVHVETGPLPASNKEAAVYFVVALNHAESQVQQGENGGRRLSHAGVVRSLNRIGTLAEGKSFAQDVHVDLKSGDDASNLRVIAFVQEEGPGRVLGVAMQRLHK